MVDTKKVMKQVYDPETDRMVTDKVLMKELGEKDDTKERMKKIL